MVLIRQGPYSHDDETDKVHIWLLQADDADTIAVEKSGKSHYFEFLTHRPLTVFSLNLWPGTEEFIKKRRVEQTTTKQVETRVKRQVLVDQDGQVVEDSGPQVTTNTTREDTETKEENHTEVRRCMHNELANESRRYASIGRTCAASFASHFSNFWPPI
jgi:hypothetical protein